MEVIIGALVMAIVAYLLIRILFDESQDDGFDF